MASSSKSEQAYIRSSLLADPPLRLDGRSPTDYRPIALETGVAPLANGSARVNIGGAALNGTGGNLAGTEVVAAVKLEVEDVSRAKSERRQEGRVSCNVSWYAMHFLNFLFRHANAQILFCWVYTVRQQPIHH